MHFVKVVIISWKNRLSHLFLEFYLDLPAHFFVVFTSVTIKLGSILCFPYFFASQLSFFPTIGNTIHSVGAFIDHRLRWRLVPNSNSLTNLSNLSKNLNHCFSRMLIVWLNLSLHTNICCKLFWFVSWSPLHLHRSPLNLVNFLKRWVSDLPVSYLIY